MSVGGGFGSLVDLLRYRAETQGSDRAYVFLADRGGEERALTFADIHRRALTFGRRLAACGKAGDRALLLFPSGLEFVEAFFGCVCAGIIPVPTRPPRHGRLHEFSSSIVADCAPRFALTTSELLDRLKSQMANVAPASGVQWMTVSHSQASDARDGQETLPTRGRGDLAFLQYTSGSTSAPKGVMVTHGNLLENLEMIRIAYANSSRSTHVNWVPLHHDMGLILNVLQTLYVGALCVLMSPATIIQRPLAWLRAIHHYRAEVAGGPNFVFDLCVKRFRAEQLRGLDLSCWKVAFNGAEPVNAETIDRFVATYESYGFASQAMHPCYGMAEATVLISGSRRGAGPVFRTISRQSLQMGRAVAANDPHDARVLVGCGRAQPGERLAIVAPVTKRRLAAFLVGEVWVSGPNVTDGYWQKPDETVAAFHGAVAGEGQGGWLRTGDLGYMDEHGELYITGRIKDVIIIRGTNQYPQDIERTVEKSHLSLRPHSGAAFAVDNAGGDELLVVVHEVNPFTDPCDLDDIVGSIRAAVAKEHELTVHRVVLIRPGTIPTTTSGKMQRYLTRKYWLEGALDTWPVEGRRAARPREEDFVHASGRGAG